MRMQASKKKTGWEEFYSEMQLFYPWRDEYKDLKHKQDKECLKKFDEVKEEILRVKKKVFPYLHFQEDINSIWEEEDYKRPSHIYDTLDSALEQENLDAEEEGTEEIPGEDIQNRLENDEGFKARLENYLKQISFQEQQQRNALTGKLGAPPGNVPASNAQPQEVSG